MPVTEAADGLDDRLRELFHSFDSSVIRSAPGSALPRHALTRGRAIAWAAVVVAVLVVTLLSLQLAQSRGVTPAGHPRSTKGSFATPPGLSVTANPQYDLHANEPVRVTVHAFGAHAAFYLSECASPDDYTSNPLGCGFRRLYMWTDGSGVDTVVYDVQVVAAASAHTSASVTCTDQCMLVASSSRPGPDQFSVAAPLTFAPPTARRTQQCGFSQLALTPRSAGAATGHTGVVLVFKNTSDLTCILHGYPGVEGLSSLGVPIVEASRTLNGFIGGAGQRVPLVTLAPGDSASALLEATDFPVGGAATCPEYASLLVSPPDTTQSFHIRVAVPGCSGLQVHPVVPGLTGSTDS